MRRLSKWLVAVVLLIAPMWLVSCGPQDVDQLRGNYSAELNSFVVREQPAPMDEEMTMEGEEGADAEGEAMEDEGMEEGEGEEGGEDAMTPPPPPPTTNVLLDISLRHEGAGKLPGVTLDITQADGSGTEKGQWKVYVDTSDLAVEKQITHTLEDVDYVDGDGFHVEVRSHVPAAEQSEYQEFSQGGGA